METNKALPNPLLIKRGLLSSDGEINSTMVNAASGALTTPLVDAIWDAHRDANVLNKTAEYLWELYDKSEFRRIICSEVAMLLAYGLTIPDSLEAILASDNEELIEAFSYEFLMDFDDARFDYAEKDAEDEM